MARNEKKYQEAHSSQWKLGVSDAFSAWLRALGWPECSIKSWRCRLVMVRTRFMGYQNLDSCEKSEVTVTWTVCRCNGKRHCQVSIDKALIIWIYRYSLDGLRVLSPLHYLPSVLKRKKRRERRGGKEREKNGKQDHGLVKKYSHLNKKDTEKAPNTTSRPNLNSIQSDSKLVRSPIRPGQTS